MPRARPTTADSLALLEATDTCPCGYWLLHKHFRDVYNSELLPAVHIEWRYIVNW